MGCAREDAIEHYALCRPYIDCCSRYLGPPAPVHRHALEDFVGIDRSSLSSWGSSSLTGAEKSALRAISVYALHMTHAQVRHGRRTSEGANACRGHLREATRCHPKSTELMVRAFASRGARATRG
ncbi:unnamed protein product [Prorocentrum cordatum]|uniref:Uncharacterized protein n=1 Tax=Prorocentrum cordatum TaxID=2364126 RepID=A0ABN9XYE2_9DINO|nr:unnamed protein product [Polarella glacialis]